MLDKVIFMQGITLINSILGNYNQIKETASFDTYYFILKDIDDVDYENGVRLLLREWEYTNKTPSPGNIISFIEKVSNKPISEEDKALERRLLKVIKNNSKDNLLTWNN